MKQYKSYARAAFALAVLSSASLFAGSFTQVISSNQSWSGSVTVPSTATCHQFAAAYTYGTNPSITVNNGPLGNYTIWDSSSPNYISLTGSVGSGTYSIYESQTGSGYSGVTLSW